jgi:glyoxylase-like metal-dependent hydrolase (beta-lactamase superfamily II)
MTWQEVGADIFRIRYQRLDQNIGAIVTADGVVVVDSRSDHLDADELRSDLARLTPKPVRWLVNTHMHWDHTFGNSRFPEATIVGHTTCRRRLLEDGVARRDRLAAEPWPYDGVKPAFGEVVIRAPEVTFDNEAIIAPGGREISLRHPGRGHTDCDIVLMVDDTCFSGDLLEEGAPPAFGDSHPREWPGTLAVVEGWLDRSTTIIPGHGDLVDIAFLRAQAAEIAAAVEAVEKGLPGPWPADVMEDIRSRM